MRIKPSAAQIEELYFGNKISSNRIGKIFGFSGRAIRGYMAEYGIKTDQGILKRGVPNFNGRGKIRSPETIRKISEANKGRPSPTKGSGDVENTCEQCGIKYTDKPYRRKRFCCVACLRSFMSIGGETHWNFNGGSANKHNRRLWKIAQDWRKRVLERDGYACVFCKSTDRLEVHHIEGFAYEESLREADSNGVTMCHKCHHAYHAKYGKKSAGWKWRAFVHDQSDMGTRAQRSV